MRVRNYKLALAVSALLASGGAYAQIDLDLVKSGEDASEIWINEFKADDGSSPTLGAFGPGRALALVKEVGASWPTGTTFFVRFDLEGAVFSGEMTLGGVMSLDCAKRGVSTGSSSAQFNCTAMGAFVPSAQFTLTPVDPGHGYKMSSKPSNLKITYTLHENTNSIELGTAGTHIISRMDDIPFLRFVQAYSLTKDSASGTVASTSDVASDFLKFKDQVGANALTVARIGHVLYDVNKLAVGAGGMAVEPLTFAADADAILPAATNVNKLVALSDVLDTKTSLVVEGNFTFIQDDVGGVPTGAYGATAQSRVWLDESEDCTKIVKVDSTQVTAESAAFQIGNDNALFPNGYHVCVNAGGLVTIEDSLYSARLQPVAKAGSGYQVAPITVADIGRITKNGTVLDTPYVTTIGGYLSRVILTNTGTADAPYKAIAITDAGADATLGAAAEGVIPKGANLQINVADLVTFSAKTRGAVRFNISAPNNTIQGVYQTVTLRSGDVQSILMMRQGGGDGQATNVGP